MWPPSMASESQLRNGLCDDDGNGGLRGSAIDSTNCPLQWQ
jgi:hypothetical protein